MRRAARRDVNHDEIANAFRGLGCSVETLHRLGEGVPDLLVGIDVGIFRLNLLVEVKRADDGEAHGALNDEQRLWHSEWRGQVAVIRGLEEVGELVRAALALGQEVSRGRGAR